MVSAFWSMTLYVLLPSEALTMSRGLTSTLQRPTEPTLAFPPRPTMRTGSPADISDRYLVPSPGTMQYSCTAPAFTRNGRVATYPLSSLSLCTRKRQLEYDPMSIPSPGCMRLQVSTHTLSPISMGFTSSTVTSLSSTGAGVPTRSLNLPISAGSDVSMTMPSVPFSMVLR